MKLVLNATRHPITPAGAASIAPDDLAEVDETRPRNAALIADGALVITADGGATPPQPAVYRTVLVKDGTGQLFGAGAGLTPIPVSAAGVNRGAWTTGAAYKTNDLVTTGAQTYTAKNDHTAGATFAGDLTAHWSLLVASTSPTTLANVVASKATADVTKATA